MISWIEHRFVYPAPAASLGNWQPPWQHQQVEFRSADGVVLHGWLLEHPHPRHWIVYFHGNGTHLGLAGNRINQLRHLLQSSVFIFDYRGYGRSQGRSSEAGLVADGRAAVEWLGRYAKRSPSDLVLIGRSLGAVVAIAVAADLHPKALVVERAFTRLSDVVRRVLPCVPVQWFLKNRFSAIDWIARYPGPVLVSHGTRDRLVPIDQGRALFLRHQGAVKEFIALDGLGHHDPDPPEYSSMVLRFLDRTDMARQ